MDVEEELAVTVAPHAGAWIETCSTMSRSLASTVAPHAGAWIETRWATALQLMRASLPMRERGLKHREACRATCNCAVAPHAGAWIETFRCHLPDYRQSRSPCGSVD